MKSPENLSDEIKNNSLLCIMDKLAAGLFMVDLTYLTSSFSSIAKNEAENKLYSIDENGLATVYIRGVILNKKSDVTFAEETSQEAIREAIATVFKDPRTEEIRLLIDSPGGVAVGTAELADFIWYVSNVTPIYAEIDRIGASAAYWLAAATQNIIANPTSIVGSIGVYSVHSDYSEMYSKFGIKQTYFIAGKYKAAGAPKPLSDSDRQALQETVDTIYDKFKTSVSAYMALDLNKSEQWAEGRTFFGEKALNLGLVTKLNTISVPTKKVSQGNTVMSEEKAKTYTEEQYNTAINGAKANAMKEVKASVLEVAKVILNNDSYNALAKALDTNLDATQLKACKDLFANIGNKVDDNTKTEELANLECQAPANNMATKGQNDKEDFIKACGNYSSNIL